ncbi:putative LRR containing protein [Trachipleistophora hominis]|uniref:Putative LRR containing protein n=1 Tax=Trachipleistophora hominis TaxID=72359 RepID=L7JQY2_TRAHO|nr:putative LRR containing protein [Trachipleistophora hominis]
MEYSWFKKANILARYILWFTNDNNSTDNSMLVCDNLGEVQLGKVFGNISHISKEPIDSLSYFEMVEYDTQTDPLGVFESRDEKFTVNDFVDTMVSTGSEKPADSAKYSYYLIRIPVTKRLFMKVVCPISQDKVFYSDIEFYSIIRHLILFIDNSSLFLYFFAQKLMDDPKLLSRLRAIDDKEETLHDRKGDNVYDSCFEMNLTNAMFEINDLTYVAVMDDQNKVAFMSKDGGTKERLPVYVSIRNLDSLLLRQFMVMSGYFLINNYENLYKKYKKSVVERGFNIEVDFSDFFYNNRRKYNHENRLRQVLVKTINEVIGCKFLRLYSIEKCTFWFQGIFANVNLNLPSTAIYLIHFDNCVFEQNVILPANLKKLWIADSEIRNDLVLPNGLEELFFEKVTIAEKVELKIGKDYQLISLKGINGNVYIPGVTKNFCVKFDSSWSFELRKNENGMIEKLHMINVVFEGTGCDISYDIMNMVLENVKVSNENTIVLRKNVIKAELIEFTGLIRISDISQHESFIVRLNSGTCQLQRTDEGDVLELLLSNADLLTTTTLNVNMTNINKRHIYSEDGLHLKLCDSIRNICLRNCFGTLFFQDWPCFSKIMFERKDAYGIKHQTFHVTKSDARTIDRIVIRDFRLDGKIRFGFGVKHIELKNVKISCGSLLIIEDAFQTFTATQCRGIFQLPCISEADSPVITLREYRGYINISLCSKNVYNIIMRNMVFDTSLIIGANINNAEFSDFKVRNYLSFTGKMCNNLTLARFDGPINLHNISSLKKLELRDLDTVNNPHILSVPAEELVAKDIIINEDIIFNSNTKKLYFGSVYKARSGNISIVFNSGCKDIIIEKSHPPINVTSIIRGVTAKDSVEMSSSIRCCLISSCPENLSKLELKDLRLSGAHRIKRNVNFVSLLNVRAWKHSTLILNENLESIRIESSSNVNIDASHVEKLVALTLTEAPMPSYDSQLYNYLTYINMSRMEINKDTAFTEGLDTIILNDVKIGKNSTIKINKNISYLTVLKTHGDIDMRGVAGLNLIRLNELHTLKLRKLQNTDDGYALVLQYFRFERDVRLPDNMEIVQLKHVSTSTGYRLILGKGCKCLDLNYSNVHVDFSQSVNLKKIILEDIPFGSLKMLLEVSSIVDTLVLRKITIEGKMRLPNQMKVVVIQQVKILNGNKLIFNKNCREANIVRCTGKFDLSETTRLDTLVIKPNIERSTSTIIRFPSLEYVRKLEISYNLNSANLQYLLSKCVNVQNLTIHSLDYSERLNVFDSISTILTDINDFLKNDAFYKDAVARYARRTKSESIKDQVKIINAITNVLLRESLDCGRRRNLISLTLVGWCLDDKNIALLEDFHSLRTLVTDYNYFNDKILENLPSQLEILGVTETNSCSVTNADKANPVHFSLKGLEENKNIKHLVLTGRMLINTGVFDCLPVNLLTLKIVWSLWVDIPIPESIVGMITVKKLILNLDTLSYSSPIYIDTNPMKRQYYKVFDILRNFINFDNLDELILETVDEVINIDKMTYRIK